MSQQELHNWAGKKLGKRKQARYERCALMNFSSYIGGMTTGMSGAEVQLLWARSQAYDAASKIPQKNLMQGGWYTPAQEFSYTESTSPLSRAPTVFLGNTTSGSKQDQISGAGQCAWFMDRVGEDLRGPATLKKGEMAVLGCYHKGWKHNFVLLAPDPDTVTAADVVLIDGWALAFGTSAERCWGAKADESWLRDVWTGISITRVYQS